MSTQIIRSHCKGVLHQPCRTLRLQHYNRATLHFNLNVARRSRPNISQDGWSSLTRRSAACKARYTTNLVVTSPSVEQIKVPNESGIESADGFEPMPRPPEAPNITQLDLPTTQRSPDSEVQFSVEETEGELVWPRTVYPNLVPRGRKKKVDLSFFSVRDRELGSETVAATHLSRNRPAFRFNKALRKIVLLYTTELAPIEYQLYQSWTMRASCQKGHRSLDEALSIVFCADHVDIIQKSGYNVEDVVSWDWILASSSIDLAIRRYVALCTDCKARGLLSPPKFIPLQILRVERMDALSLDILLQHIIGEASSAQTGRSNSTNWDTNSATLLIIRLLRHARIASPDSLPTISRLISSLILGKDPTVKSLPGSPLFQQMTHLYNRFLTLLSLPTTKTPFKSIPFQQEAQFDLMRQMLEIDSPIPVTREGYRALATVQLGHVKTFEERRWAATKTLSWPPWRKDLSGLDATEEYSGRESRARLILRKMNEAGYSHAKWEHQVSVLAGWDVDKSPTIQTRHVLLRSAMPWSTPFSTVYQQQPVISSTSITEGYESPTSAHQVWAARITATRTLKEAWACFLSYKTKHDGKALHNSVYHAMFSKLLARSVTRLAMQNQLPGDSREVFAEPTAVRDQVYTHMDVPTPTELYEDMLRQGVKPSGRFLSDLLDHATDFGTGFKYINESATSEPRRAVLLHLERCRPDKARDTLQSLPPHLLASVVRWIVRCANDNVPRFQKKSDHNEKSGHAETNFKASTPVAYAVNLMLTSESTYLPAWHALLTGLANQLVRSPKGHVNSKDIQHRHGAKQIWKWLTTSLDVLDRNGVNAEELTFQKIAAVVNRLLVLRNGAATLSDYLTITKKTFLQFVYGSGAGPWLPDSTKCRIATMPCVASLMDLVFTLGVARDVSGLVKLAQWVALNGEQIHDRGKDLGRQKYTLADVVLTIQTFISPAWNERFFAEAAALPTASPEQMTAVQEICSRFTGSMEDVNDMIMENNAAFWKRAEYAVRAQQMNVL